MDVRSDDAPWGRAPVPWVELATLFALECVAPLFELAGLVIPPALLLSSSRRALAECGAVAEGPAGVDDAIAQILLTTVADGGGPDEAQALRRWCRRTAIFAHADHPQWSGWAHVFEVAVSDERGEELPLPAREKAALTTSYGLFTEIDDARAVVGGARRRTIPDRDVLLMAFGGFDPDYEPLDPFSKILSFVYMHRFQRFALEATSWMPEALLERLRDWGTVLLNEDAIWMPAPLVQLDRLTRLECS